MNTTFRYITGVVGVVALSATLSACGSSQAVTPEQATDSVSRGRAAITLAEQHVGGKAFALDAEGANGWDIDVVADGAVTEVRVNEQGTEVTRTRADGRIDADDRVLLERATVAMTDGIATAAGQVTGTLLEAEIDRHRLTSVVWSVQFATGSDDVEVYVDAVTGEVLKVERD